MKSLLCREATIPHKVLYQRYISASFKTKLLEYFQQDPFFLAVIRLRSEMLWVELFLQVYVCCLGSSVVKPRTDF